MSPTLTTYICFFTAFCPEFTGFFDIAAARAIRPLSISSPTGLFDPAELGLFPFCEEVVPFADTVGLFEKA